ncbi:Hypothetical protein, putative, partial [Bodo saltans]
MVTAGQVDVARRLALLTISSDFAISFSSFSLFGVKGVFPTVVDENGGAVITVQGVGFLVGSVVLCNVSGGIVVANVSSTSLLTCTTEKAAPTSSVCVTDPVNLIFMNASSRTTFNTLVGIVRPTSATLVTATSELGNVGFGAYDTAVSVTIAGFGFVQTTEARCRFVRLSDNYVIFYSTVTYVSSNVVVCVQQPADPMPNATGFQYSHDGAYYSTNTYAPYTIVGPTKKVTSFASNLTIVAGASSQVPSVQVYLTDAYGNNRLALETSIYSFRATSLDPVVQIAGNVELVTFTNGSTVVESTVGGIASFANIGILTPTAGTFTLNFFSTVDITLTTSVEFTIIAGVAAALSMTTSAAWRAGVFSTIKLTPAPTLKVTDAAGNIIASADTTARVIFTSATQALDGSINMGSTTQYAVAGSDGFFSFPSIQIKTVFDTDAFMVFSVGTVPSLRVFVPQETCVEGLEYAETGTFSCANCPANSVCDGTSTVKVDPGFWRAAGDAFEFYACTPAEACPGGTGCATGYTSTMCAACEVGYGKNQGTCTECLNPTINWVLTLVILGAFVVIVYVLSIGGMTVTCLRDAELAKLEKVQHNPLSVVIKIGVSYLQMITVIPFAKLNMPSWMNNFITGSASGSKFNPNLSFIGCLFASNEADTLTVVLIVFPIAIVICVILSIVFAYIRTYKGVDLVKAKAELNLMAADRGAATKQNLRADLARTMSRSQLHYVHIMNTHYELFADANQIVNLEKEHLAEIEQRKIDLKQRLLNMLLVSILVALFFLYPTIVQYAAEILNCSTVDFGLSHPSRSVLTKDPSVDCSSDQYRRASLMAWGSLAGLGVGIPWLNYLFIITLRKFTCGGDHELAKTIFFFTTGGYRNEVWFWLTISLLRKMCIVLAMTIPSDTDMKLLAGLWVLMLSVLFNISHKPWAERMLSLVETTTLSAIAATYGLLELTFFETVSSSDTNLLMVYIAVAVVNLLSMLSLAVGVSWSAQKTLANLAAKPGPIGYFFTQILASTDELSVKIRVLSETIRDMHEKMLVKLPRTYKVALVELAVSQLIVDHDEKVEARTNVLSQFRKDSDDALMPSKRRSSR